MTDSYDIFGSYVLLKKVYEDDLGHLFRAGLIAGGAIDRTVWLRVLDGAGIPRAAVIKAFDRARDIGRRIGGAQVPTRPFFVSVDGVPALGCDHIPGQPLDRVLARARDEAFPLQPDNCLLIIDKLALALSAGEAIQVAGHAVLHSFLHPGLVHLSYDGDAIVSGFGLGDALLASLDDPGAAADGRAYFAPEVLAGDAAVPQSDVYALGAILFHLLTGTALPTASEDRRRALDSAHLAWDGEALPTDIRSLVSRSLAPSPEARFGSATVFRNELDRLLYGGAYSPTTFNLAMFMDRLFRSEIETDEIEMQAERTIDSASLLATGHEPGGTTTDSGPSDLERPVSEGEDQPLAMEPEAVAVPRTGRGRRMLWAALGGIVIIALVAGVFWLGRTIAPPPEPQNPTPSAAQIAARRLAQEERLRTLTQAMVQEMMAEREEEIRQELIARQTRIEELQRRLQQSERRAAKSAAAAADEAETQQALMREIEEQERAQQAQQDRLEAERREALDSAAEQAVVTAGTPSTAAELAADEGEPVAAGVAAPPPTAAPSPTVKPIIAAEPTKTFIAVGSFVPPDEVDTLPVVIKSQALEWPRNAARSGRKGVVVVKLTVNAEGGVDDVEVLRADDTGWGIPEAAVEAAAQYRFKPGTKDGVAVTTSAFVTWRYDFTDQ